MKKTFKVDGMSCEHCQKRVERALSGLAGVSGAVVLLDAGSAEVDFDETAVTEAALIAAIEDVGYDVVR